MFLLEVIKAIIFGLVEGVTEWLPVSSTGHLILLNEFLYLDVSEGFYEAFEVIIQLGAIFAVVARYPKRFLFFGKDSDKIKRNFALWSKVALATLPSAVVGAILDDLLDEYLYTPWVVSVTLVLYGVAFILTEWLKPRVRCESVFDVTARDALAVGAFQCLSLIPGTSRSGATILGATMMGYSRSSAAEFSFFLAVPTMLGASTLKGVKFALEYGAPSPAEMTLLAVGMAVSFLVSVAVIGYLTDFVKKHSFVPFGVYRVVLGAAVALYFFMKGRI